MCRPISEARCAASDEVVVWDTGSGERVLSAESGQDVLVWGASSVRGSQELDSAVGQSCLFSLDASGGYGRRAVAGLRGGDGSA